MSLFKSIGKLIGKVAPLASTVLPFIPGGAAFAPFARAAGAVFSPQTPGPVAPRVPFGIPGFRPGRVMPGVATTTMAVAPLLRAAPRALPRAPTAIARTPGVSRTTTGRIRGVTNPDGKFVSRKNMVKLAKQIGLEAAATALGITALEMATAIEEEISKPRRRRGITGRDLATAKRVQRQVLSTVRQLQCVGSVSVRKPTARSCCK